MDKLMQFTTEQEVQQAFKNLRSAIRGNRTDTASELVRSLLSRNAAETWRFLLTSASSDVSYQDLQTPVTVRTLHDNWVKENNPVYAVHAAIVLTQAAKGTSAGDLTR